jgi:DNA-binding MarR family transcriptional regulator
MKLSEQDMRALHYLIVAKRQGEIVTPGMIAAHLRISAASTTKLLNRLERDNHITRRLHPRDRRAFVIEVTPETEASAKQTVGRQQARRFYAAARLTSEERAAVTRFLTDMTEEISLTRADWAGTTVSEG